MLDRLREMWPDRSIKLKEMAQMLGYSEPTISNQARQLGLPSRSKRGGARVSQANFKPRPKPQIKLPVFKSDFIKAPTRAQLMAGK